MNKRVTLKDFARETGVSVSAVSRILNGKETYCSAAKCKEILDLAARWNYKPNIGYRIMTGMSTDIVAIICSQERVAYSEHVQRLLVDLISRLEEKGYASYFAVMTADPGKNYEKLQELEQKGCRSFIFIGSPSGREELLSYVQKNGYSYIGLNLCYQTEKEIRANGGVSDCAKSLFFDETAAIFRYLEIFREKGIGNFRLLMPEDYFQSRLRASVSESALPVIQRSLVTVPSFEFTDSDGFAERYANAYEVIRNEYAKDPGIRGVICITDYSALGAARFFQEAGFRVGQDVLVCGMFNTSTARFSSLPICTSSFDLKKASAEILKHLFSSADIHLALKPEIIINHQ